MAEPVFAALIPAAGLSSRMGAPKPLLDIGGQTLVERVVNLFRAAGVTEVVTVAGHRGDELVSILERTSCRVASNPDYQEGMFSSIQVGARELQGRCDAFFVLPVDIPLVRPMTIRHLMERFGNRSALAYHPAAGSGRGHPPLIDSSLIEELLAFTGTGGLKVFLEGYADRSVEVPVADAWIRRDVDTDEELTLLRRDFERYTIPTRYECDVMLDHYLEVPEAVKAHSLAVNDVTARLGGALNAAGEHLDLDLLNASALLHDAFKGVKDHAGRGAAWLKENGFPEVAAIVAEHMDTMWKEGDGVDERALVYLTDKIVEGERVVTLSERREAMLDRYAHDEEARRAIRTRLDTAAKIQSAVEKITGRTIDSLLKG